MRKVNFFMVVFLMMVMAGCSTNPGKPRTLVLNVQKAEMTKFDTGVPAVKLTLSTKETTNPNLMVDGKPLNEWFVVGESKQLERLSCVGGSKITMTYRSIDEENGLVLLLSF